MQYHTDEGVVEAVNGIDIELEKGRTLGLVGETGAGKTTTARSIMQLIQSPPGKIIKGSISLNGLDVMSASEKQLEKSVGPRSP